MLPPENPILAKMYVITAIIQYPSLIKKKEAVEPAPINIKKTNMYFFLKVISASAPKKGAKIKIKNPDKEFATPNKAVLSESLKLLAQKLLKKIGKNPAMTVVAKAEFAQS